MWVGFIGSTFDMHKTDLNFTFLILGNFNFDCIKLSTCERLSCMQNLLNEYNMVVRDNLDVNRVAYTYRQEKLHHYSLIDHLLICNNDLHLVKEYSVINTGTNLSDHCAINAIFVYKGSNKINVVKQANDQVTQVLLWKIFWTPRNV